MAVAIRSHRWSDTPLGPIQIWPTGLRVAVRLMLTDPDPQAIWWGQALVQLPNDAFVAVSGMGLGTLARSTWATIWPTIAARVEAALAGDWTIAAPIVAGDLSWTFRPIENDAGGVGGVMLSCRRCPGDGSASSTDSHPEPRAIDRRPEPCSSGTMDVGPRPALQRPADLVALRQLHDLYQKLQIECDLNVALGEILALAVRFGQTDRGCIRLSANGGLAASHGLDDRLTGQLAEADLPYPRGQQILIDDLDVADGASLFASHDIAAICATPMTSPGAEPIGSLCLFFAASRRPSADALPLLDLLGWIAAEMVERHRSTARMQEAQDRETFLVDLGKKLRAIDDPVRVQEITVQMLGERIGVDRCGFCSIDPQTRMVHILPEYDRGAHRLTTAQLAGSSFGALADLLRSGKLVVVDDVECDGALSECVRPFGTRALIAVPILRQGELIAVFYGAQATARIWTPEEVQLFQQVAERSKALIKRARAEAALRDAEERFRLTTQLLPSMLWQSDATGRSIVTNHQWETRTGQSEADAQDGGWLRVIHPDDVAEEAAAFHHAFATGQPLERQQRIRMRDGSYRYFLMRQVPVCDSRGEIVRWYGAATDIHELRQLQERQALLVSELQHRVRNMLTIVRSVFDRTIETGGSMEDIEEHFRGRLDALARTQVVVAQNPDGVIDLENLIRDELLSIGVSDGPAIRIAGPDVSLPLVTAEPIGLAIHELTVNSLKYGALKVPNARLEIAWRLDLDHGDGQKLNLSWTERGVPAINPCPARQGFGRELIEEALPYRLGAETQLEFRGGGVHCTIVVPLPEQGTVGTILSGG